MRRESEKAIIRECEIGVIGRTPHTHQKAPIHPERGRRNLKVFDRYLGIGLVYLLGFLRRKNRKIQGVKKVAILKTAAIGDTILLSAITQDIKARFPEARIVFFSGSNNFEAAGLLPDVDQIVQLPIRKPTHCIRLIRSSGTFDVWLDFGSWPRLDALLSHFSKSHVKIGFKTRGQFRHYVYDIPVEHSSETHEVYNFKRLLQPINAEGTALPSISVNGESGDSNYIVVHMFPGGTKSFLREWPSDNWIKFISGCLELGYRIYLTGGEYDRPRAELLRSKIGSDSVKVVAGQMDLRSVAVLLKDSEALVTVNTGIMHLGAALGTRVIALNGPSSPVRWGPLGENSTIIYRNEYGPCMDLGFESRCISNVCMQNIKVEDVMEEIRMLKGRHQNPA